MANVNNLSRRPKRNREPLPAAPDPESIPAQRVSAFRTAAPDSVGAGILSPLTEDIEQRTYHGERTLVSADGLFSLVYEPAREVVTYDLANTEVTIVFGDPDA